MHCMQVQELASAAMSWCAARGGNMEAKDMISKLSKLGAGGRHPQNAERDLQATIRMYGHAIGAEIETCRVRLWDPKQEKVFWTDMPATFLHVSTNVYEAPAPSNPNPFSTQIKHYKTHHLQFRIQPLRHVTYVC